MLMRPRSEGGVLHHKGQVEVVSSLSTDGTPIPYDIRFGVWVVFALVILIGLTYALKRAYWKDVH